MCLQNTQQILIVLAQIQQTLDQLLAFECTPITTVPITITKPGCYKVLNELPFAGKGAAITIATNDVIIDDCNFTLTLTNAGPSRDIVGNTGISNIIISTLLLVASFLLIIHLTVESAFLVLIVCSYIMFTLLTSVVVSA